MNESTVDPDVVIIERGTINNVPYIHYERISNGEQWRVLGTCNQCGLCVIGVNAPDGRYVWDGPPGTPLASRDLWYGQRLDEPLTVAFKQDMEQMAQEMPTATVNGCSFTFEAR